MLRVYHFDTRALSEADRRELMMPTSDDALVERATRHFLRGGYYPVAEVQAGSRNLEAAWRATQNIDNSWSLEPAPECKPIWRKDEMAYGMRSSMMGDIVEVIEDGKVTGRHVAVTFGFRPLLPPAGA